MSSLLVLQYLEQMTFYSITSVAIFFQKSYFLEVVERA